MGLNLKADWYEVSGNEIKPGSKHPYEWRASATWEIDGNQIRRGLGHPSGYSAVAEWDIQSDGTVRRNCFHPQGSSFDAVGLD